MGRRVFSSGSYSFGVWLSIRGQKHCPLQLSLLKVAVLIPAISVLFCFTNVCSPKDLPGAVPRHGAQQFSVAGGKGTEGPD